MSISSDVLVVISTGLSGILSFLLGFKMRKAQVKTNELDNVEQAIEIWRKLADDLNKEVQIIKEENRKLVQQVALLNRQVKELQAKNEELKNELNILQKP